MSSNAGRLLVAAARRTDSQPPLTSTCDFVRGARRHGLTTPPRGPRSGDGSNTPRLVGTCGATLAQQRWQYGQLRPGDAALSTALSLGIDVAVNVITEFAGSP